LKDWNAKDGILEQMACVEPDILLRKGIDLGEQEK
jgi:hypothetical protein